MATLTQRLPAPLRRGHTALALLIVCLASGVARADVQTPDFGKVSIAAGGSLGHGKSGWGGGAEATLKLRSYGPSLSIGGTEVGGSYLYAEATYYYWLSAGLGAGYRVSPSRRGFALSPFLGLPIPLGLPHPSPAVVYLEPYLRPQIALGGKGPSELELGVLLKVNLALVRGFP
jgi:hypothetical protein